MASTREQDSQAYVRKVDFKDLTLILRESLADKTLEIIDLVESNFIPVGENFGSIMVKLDVTVCKNNFKKKEQLHLVAKTMNPIDKPIICWNDAFKKELFLYTELMPAYRDLEREVGIPEKELIDLIPKYYGHRFSLNNNSYEIGDNSLFLMENMKVRSYYTGNKNVGEEFQYYFKVYRSLNISLSCINLINLMNEGK